VPSSVAHAAAAIAIGAVLRPAPVPRRFWYIVGVASAAPDVDVLLRWNHASAYNGMFAHRGITHSAIAAFAIAVGITVAAFGGAEFARRRRQIIIALTLAVASHGVLDSLCQYGPGVMILAPLSNRRFSSPWRPISGAVDGLHRGKDRLIAVVAEEVQLIIAPAGLILMLTELRRKVRRDHTTTGDLAGLPPVKELSD
jgi:inner membrane protein